MAIDSQVVLKFEAPNLLRVHSGKVRELFDLGDCLLIVATDRLSAFDVILPNGIPKKGEVLTRMSNFWFEQTQSIVRNHCQGINGAMPLECCGEELKGRAMLVKKAKPLPIECVVRGFMAGSGWKEYKATGAICGNILPSGIQEWSRLPTPLFTPAIKSITGRDANITFSQAAEIVGQETAVQVRDLSLALYAKAQDFALKRGFHIADTKFEFGYAGDDLLLIDELLTPDSSRFWLAKDQRPSCRPESFDKQIVRDWLESTGWDKVSLPPKLPENVVEKTRSRYIEVCERLTGERFA